MSSTGQELQGKVAIITGGGRGIGKGIAERLAEVGAEIIIADMDTCDSKQQAAVLFQTEESTLQDFPFLFDPER